MGFWDSAVMIVLIVFGSLTAPFCIWQLGCILRDKRKDRMEWMRLKAQHELEEMKIKAEMESRILGGSAISDNLTAELQSLREEISRLRNEVEQIKSAGQMLDHRGY